MLTDAPSLGRPHAFSGDNRTKITKHADENPGMSARCFSQELSHKYAKKKEGYFPYRISVLHELKLEDYTKKF